MARLLFLLLATLPALAQTAEEAPAEHASTTTIAVFIVLFFGTCVGIVWYAIRSGRREKQQELTELERKSGGG